MQVIFSAGCALKPITKVNAWEREDKSAFISAEALLPNQKLMFPRFERGERGSKDLLWNKAEMTEHNVKGEMDGRRALKHKKVKEK